MFKEDIFRNHNGNEHFNIRNLLFFALFQKIVFYKKFKKKFEFLLNPEITTLKIGFIHKSFLPLDYDKTYGESARIYKNIYKIG